MSWVLEIALLLLAAAAAVLLSIDLFGGRRREERVREHLDRLRGDEQDEDEIRLAPPDDPLTRRLRAAGLSIGPLPFLGLLAAFGLLVAIGIVVAFPAAGPAAVIGGVVAAYVAYLALREWGRARARRFERKLVDGVDHVVSALIAGEAPTRALASAASAAEGAVREELEEVVSRLGVGLDIRQALERMVTRYDSEGVRLLTQTLAVKWQAGGDLAPVLRAVGRIMRERIRLGMRLRSELTGVQIAGLAIAVLPYLLIPVFFWVRPGWAGILQFHPLAPRLLLVAVALQLVGLIWLRRTLRIEL